MTRISESSSTDFGCRDLLARAHGQGLPGLHLGDVWASRRYRSQDGAPDPYFPQFPRGRLHLAPLSELVLAKVPAVHFSHATGTGTIFHEARTPDPHQPLFESHASLTFATCSQLRKTTQAVQFTRTHGAERRWGLRLRQRAPSCRRPRELTGCRGHHGTRAALLP